MRILQVDATSSPINQSNSLGLSEAYRREGELLIFEYRAIAEKYGVAAMNAQLADMAARWQPDLIHLEKAELVTRDTLLALRKHTEAKLMYVFPDYRPELPRFVRHACPIVDWVLYPHADPQWGADCRAAGAHRLAFWTRGVDTDIFKPYNTPKQRNLAMMANQVGAGIKGVGWGRRDAFVAHMARESMGLHLFGQGSVIDCTGIIKHPHADLSTFARAVSSTKIVLAYNTTRVPFYTSWRRIFNTLACEGFLLIHYFPGLEQVFRNRHHLVWFNTFDEAVELARYYLAHDEERAAVGAAGRAEVVANHTWDIRVRRMMRLAFGVDTPENCADDNLWYTMP